MKPSCGNSQIQLVLGSFLQLKLTVSVKARKEFSFEKAWHLKMARGQKTFCLFFLALWLQVCEARRTIIPERLRRLARDYVQQAVNRHSVTSWSWFQPAAVPCTLLVIEGLKLVARPPSSAQHFLHSWQNFLFSVCFTWCLISFCFRCVSLRSGLLSNVFFFSCCFVLLFSSWCAREWYILHSRVLFTLDQLQAACKFMTVGSSEPFCCFQKFASIKNRKQHTTCSLSCQFVVHFWTSWQSRTYHLLPATLQLVFSDLSSYSEVFICHIQPFIWIWLFWDVHAHWKGHFRSSMSNWAS